MNILVLDPRISYDALKEEFNDDSTMMNQLEDSKAKLRAHFNAKYVFSDIIWITFVYPIPLHAVCDLRLNTHHLANQQFTSKELHSKVSAKACCNWWAIQVLESKTRRLREM